MLSRLDRFLVPSPDPARIGWLREWAFAHRGLHDERAPENSLAAFAGAVERGMGVECDIQRSRDHAAMLMHDWELERLTGVSGPTACYSAEELAQIAYLDSEHMLARLDDLLALVDGRVPILIEIKSRRRYDIEESCVAVRDALAGYGGRHAVMSFDPRVSRWFRKHAPQTVQGLVMREDHFGMTQTASQRHLALWLARPEFIAYHIAALPNPMVAARRAAGTPVLTWTVDTPDLRDRARLHADTPIAEGAGVT
ncbi:MAG: glycerophosphodiester phosphodiesterase family protein [Erythrobacter sp.]